MLQTQRWIAIAGLAMLAGCQLGRPRAPVPLAVAGAALPIAPARSNRALRSPIVPVANVQNAGGSPAARPYPKPRQNLRSCGSFLPKCRSRFLRRNQLFRPQTRAHRLKRTRRLARSRQLNFPARPKNCRSMRRARLAVPEPAPARLPLFAAIETSLAQNPDLVALRRNEGVGLGALGVAQTYPFNPFVQTTVTPIQTNPGGGSGSVYHYVLLMQQIQLAHQQRYREEAAMASLTSVRWNIHQAELLNLAQTERLYFTALYQRGIRDLALASAHLNQELERVSQRQLEAGQASAADVAIVRLDARSTRRQAQLAEAVYQTAMLDLRRQLNVPIGQPLELEGDLLSWQWRTPTIVGACCPGESVQVDAHIEQQLAELVSGRPDVMAARADLAAARSTLSLARASRAGRISRSEPYYERDDLRLRRTGVSAPQIRCADHEQWPAAGAAARGRNAAAIGRLAATPAAGHARNAGGNRSLSACPRNRGRRANRCDRQPARRTPASGGAIQGGRSRHRARLYRSQQPLARLRRGPVGRGTNEAAQAAANLTAASGLPPDSLLSPAAPQPIQ